MGKKDTSELLKAVWTIKGAGEIPQITCEIFFIPIHTSVVLLFVIYAYWKN